MQESIVGKRILTADFVLSLVGPACNEPSSQSPAASQDDGRGEALFQDDYSDPDSGWFTEQGTSAPVERGSAEFRIFVDNPAHLSDLVVFAA